MTRAGLLLVLIVSGSVCVGAQEPRTDRGDRGRQIEDRPEIVARSLRVPASVAQRDEIEHAIQARAWDRAERLLAAEAERVPDAPEVLTLLARIFILDRKPLNAAVAIKKAEALGPIDDETRFMLSLAYISIGRGAWAVRELERLAATDPSNVIYVYWLARIDYDAGQYDSAIRRLQEVVARDRRFMRAYDNLGLCYEAQNQPERAIVQYREAIRLNREAATKSPWPSLNLGVLLRQRGELQEAEALLREAIRDDGQLARAHYELGTLLEQQGRTAEALEALARAVTANADYAEPHYALARIYRRQGRTVEGNAALATFRRLSDAREARHRELAVNRDPR